MPQLVSHQNESLILKPTTISDVNHINTKRKHPEVGQYPKTVTQEIDTGSSSSTTADMYNRMSNISSGQKNCFNRDLAKNIPTRRKNTEEIEITFTKGIKKKLVSTRAIRMKSNLKAVCSGANYSQTRSSRNEEGNYITTNSPGYTRERSQLRYPGFFSSFQKMRSVVLKLRDSQTSETSSYDDGGFSFSRTLNQVRGSQNKVPESQNPRQLITTSSVLTEVSTSKFKVFPEQLKNSQSAMGPYASSVYPVEKLEHRGGGRRVYPVSPWGSLTAYSKTRFAGATNDFRVNEVKKTRDWSRNKTRGGRERTVKDLRLLKRGVVVMTSAVKRKMKKNRELKKKKKRRRESRGIMILKSVRKCRSFADATLSEKWNEREEKQRKEEKRGGDDGGIRIGVRKEKSFAKRGRVRRNGKSKFQLKATNSKDPIGRKITSSIIITGCHQQKQYKKFHEKCRKQPTAPELTSLVVVLLIIIIPLLFAAGRWFQARKAWWKRLLQARGTFNVKSTNSCSYVLTYPYRQLRICFLLLTLSLEAVYMLLLLKLSSSLLLLIPLAYSSGYQHLLKYRAQNYTNIKKHYSIYLRVLLRRNLSFGYHRIQVGIGKPIFNKFYSTPSSSSFINTVQTTTQLRPQENYQQLNFYHSRMFFCQKVNTNCENTNHTNNRANKFGYDYYLNHYDSHLRWVARRPSDNTSCPELLKIKAFEKRPDSESSRDNARKIYPNSDDKDDKCVTSPSGRLSVNVTTCTVSEAYNSDNNSHLHSHTRNKSPRSERPESGRSYLYQLPKCKLNLNKNYKIILIMTDGVLLRSGGWRCRFKLYNKKLASYNHKQNNNNNNDNTDNISGSNTDKHIAACVTSFPTTVRESPNSVVITEVEQEREDELDGIVTVFPNDKDIGQFGRIIRFRDNSYFRPNWGLVYCDKPKTELALYDEANESNISWTSKYYYEIQKLTPPGNKVSDYYSNQRAIEKGEKEERIKRRSIVFSSQQTRSRRIWPAEKIITGADEKLNLEKSYSSLNATNQTLNNTEGMTITTTYEKQREMVDNNCIGDACVTPGKRRRRRRLIVSSWRKKSSSFRGVRIISRSNLGDRKPSIGRGCKLPGVDFVVPHSAVPEFRKLKDSQATVDAKTKLLDHHTGNLSTTAITIPPEWTLSTYNQRKAKMETTSPGILTQIPFFRSRIQILKLEQLTAITDTLQLNSTTYNNSDNNINNNSSEPLKVTNDICTGFDTSASTQNRISVSRAYNNGPLRALAARRPLANHQIELSSSKTHENRIAAKYENSENTSLPYTVSSSQKSCSNSRSDPHCPTSCPLSPTPIHHHQHNNHHQKQQQQHSPYQHNNNNKNNINSYYYSYFCDYIKKSTDRFSPKNLFRIMPDWGKTFLSLLLIFQVLGTSMLTSALAIPKKKQLSNEMKGMSYLTSFGYVCGPSQEAKNLMSESVKIESIKRFQRFANLPVTGIFDYRTMEMMEKPRCGNPDTQAVTESPSGRRHKRYILSESHWGRTNLTFRFINYTPDINFPKIRKAIYDAFLVWSRVTHLTFTEIMFDSNNGKDADIRIQFAQRFHNDGYPFDGEGIILAHAFFPGENNGGDTHFDDDEHWTVDSEDGVNLFMVAAHEFGHALGLSHSKTPGSLMYPWYQGKQSKGYQLPQDDVNGIQKLYGVKNGNETIDILVKEYPDESPNTDDYNTEDEVPHGNCTHTFDAITQIRGDVYIFKGKYFWRWTSGGLKDSKPIPISHFWYQFPEDSIDAVFERKRDSKIMFFKGDKYWLYNANHMERGWPAEGRPLVELGLPGDLKKIDAAFTWSYNKRTYLVSDDMYWKFDEMESYMVYDYPRAMTIWKGVPTPLDAAFQFTDNKTYFIKGKYYWEYEDHKMRVKTEVPTGNIAERWMQCPSQQKRRPHDNSRLHKKPIFSGSEQITKVSGLLLSTVGYITSRLIA